MKITEVFGRDRRLGGERHLRDTLRDLRTRLDIMARHATQPVEDYEGLVRDAVTDLNEIEKLVRSSQLGRR